MNPADLERSPVGGLSVQDMLWNILKQLCCLQAGGGGSKLDTIIAQNERLLECLCGDCDGGGDNNNPPDPCASAILGSDAGSFDNPSVRSGLNSLARLLFYDLYVDVTEFRYTFFSPNFQYTPNHHFYVPTITSMTADVAAAEAELAEYLENAFGKQAGRPVIASVEIFPKYGGTHYDLAFTITGTDGKDTYNALNWTQLQPTDSRYVVNGIRISEYPSVSAGVGGNIGYYPLTINDTGNPNTSSVSWDSRTAGLLETSVNTIFNIPAFINGTLTVPTGAVASFPAPTNSADNGDGTTALTYENQASCAPYSATDYALPAGQSISWDLNFPNASDEVSATINGNPINL